jgi:proteasome lid subunit RPN8/RPN11
VEISAATIEEIKNHASLEFPDECCGVVVGLAGRDQRVVRVRNVQDQMHADDPGRYPRTARTAYSGHPTDLKEALDLASGAGNRLLAFYHSHPDHDAYFSDEDVAQATPFGEPSYPEALQVVVSVYDGQAGQLRVYAWSAGEQTYEEVPL